MESTPRVRNLAVEAGSEEDLRECGITYKEMPGPRPMMAREGPADSWRNLAAEAGSEEDLRVCGVTPLPGIEVYEEDMPRSPPMAR